MISIVSEFNLNISERILHFLTLFTKDIPKEIQEGMKLDFPMIIFGLP